jgi:hypothetical protein
MYPAISAHFYSCYYSRRITLLGTWPFIESGSQMFFDLNIPITAPASLKYSNNASKKKGKQKASLGELPEQPSVDLFAPSQVEAVEKRIDILVHCESIHDV